MKILFLDIDGVLNTPTFIDEVDAKIFSSGQIDPRLIDNLNIIVAQTNCKIVVSSTWRRHNSIQVLQKTLEDRRFKGSIIDLTPINDLPRHLQIEQWLDTTSLDVKKFVIVDDFYDMPNLTRHFVKTNEKFGLTEEDAFSCIKILNKN